MRLVQARMVTDDVARLAAFYARLTQTDVVLNDYYVEIPAGPASIGFSKRSFTEYATCRAVPPACRGEVILDFLADDVAAEYQRIKEFGVTWVMPPTTQPWGSRAMIFADPEGTLVNVFSPGRGLGPLSTALTRRARLLTPGGRPPRP